MVFFRLKSEPTKIADFVSTWGKCYDDSDKDCYEKNLNRHGLMTADNIQLLFEWKNNMRLAPKKQKIADAVKAKLQTLNDFRRVPNVTEAEFDSFWKFTCSIIDSGIVYRIFLAHISRPDDFPMVDQHVLRAWNFLIKSKVKEPEQTPDNYLKYREFVKEMSRQSGKTFREIDKALMPFGQFLSSQFYGLVES
jgi:hypothetical protein